MLVAAATAQALTSTDPIGITAASAKHVTLAPFRSRLEIASAWLDTAQAPDAIEVRLRLGNGIAAAESCVTSIYLAARFLRRPFPEMVSFVAACGGDVDTIGAMAGAIWGAANGTSALPHDSLARLESADTIRDCAAALHAQCIAARPTR